jgi:hypothetical protein
MLSAVAAALAVAISPVPAPGTPSLVPHKGPATETIRQIARCGGRMYAAGQLAAVRSKGRRFTRHGTFSFAASKPYAINGWNPDPGGPVNSIALNSGCTRAWLGTSHGVTEVTVPGGKRVAGFRSAIGGTVNRLVLWRGHLLAGGLFPGSFTSLNPATGRPDGFAAGLRITGSEPPHHDPTKVWNMQLHGSRLLVEGDFTSVAGQPRRQIFMLNLGSRARLSGWRSAEFNGQCTESFYIRAAAWSPSGSTIYIADTGAHATSWHGGPLTGLCDAVAAFPAKAGPVRHTWVNYSGCDSFFSAGFAGGMVFAAGHPRWIDNRHGCNRRGPGAIPYRGLVALTPSGRPVLSGGRARYSMSPANADDMLTTAQGLWIASSNRDGDDQCGHVGGHAGLCLLRS